MDKINVEVYLPALNKSYDLLLFPSLKVGEAAKLILKTIKEYEQIPLSDNEIMLCDRDKKKILDNNVTLEKAEIQDGSSLLLI